MGLIEKYINFTCKNGAKLLRNHQKMPKKSSFQQSQTWYGRFMQVFENAKFLGDLTIYNYIYCFVNCVSL